MTTMEKNAAGFSQTTEKQPWEEPTVEIIVIPWRDIISGD